jgi:hypothetical protein
MAPEQYSTEYTNKIDVYSYALIAYEVYVGTPVFSSKLAAPQVFGAAMRGERPAIPASVPEGIGSIISRGWSVDANDRPTFTEICDELRSIVPRARCCWDHSPEQRYCSGLDWYGDDSS